MLTCAETSLEHLCHVALASPGISMGYLTALLDAVPDACTSSADTKQPLMKAVAACIQLVDHVTGKLHCFDEHCLLTCLLLAACYCLIACWILLPSSAAQLHVMQLAITLHTMHAIFLLYISIGDIVL
jgi:hypothetical protein